MHAEIAWLDLSNRRRSLIGYCLGMAVYALAVVAMYPAFRTSTSLDKLIQSDSTAAALFGVTGRISSSGGWLNGNIYANFLPLIMLLLTIGYGASCLAGQDEDGTLGPLAVLPVRRTAIVVQKTAAMPRRPPCSPSPSPCSSSLAGCSSWISPWPTSRPSRPPSC